VAESPEARDRLTVAFYSGDDAGDFAAVAWRGDDLVVLQFYELLQDRTFMHPFAREIRAYQPHVDDPDTIPVEELEERLERWVRSEYPHLPVIRIQDGAWPTTEYQDSGIRQVPFNQMTARVIREFGQQEVEGSFAGPSAEQLEFLVDHPEAFAGSSARQIAAHAAQLQAVDAYVKAIENGSTAPLKEVAEKLDVDHVRARNLIQFARNGGFLTGGRTKGRATGRPTKEAFEWMADLEARIETYKGVK